MKHFSLNKAEWATTAVFLLENVVAWKRNERKKMKGNE